MLDLDNLLSLSILTTCLPVNVRIFFRENLHVNHFWELKDEAHPWTRLTGGWIFVCAFYLLNSCTDCKLIYLYKYLTQLYASFSLLDKLHCS